MPGLNGIKQPRALADSHCQHRIRTIATIQPAVEEKLGPMLRMRISARVRARRSED